MVIKTNHSYCWCDRIEDNDSRTYRRKVGKSYFYIIPFFLGIFLVIIYVWIKYSEPLNNLPNLIIGIFSIVILLFLFYKIYVRLSPDEKKRKKMQKKMNEWKKKNK